MVRQYRLLILWKNESFVFTRTNGLSETFIREEKTASLTSGKIHKTYQVHSIMTFIYPVRPIVVFIVLLIVGISYLSNIYATFVMVDVLPRPVGASN